MLRLTSLDVELTRRCNLCCPYCYMAQGECAALGDMTAETIADCLELVARFGAGSPTKINFYGGEPMLAFDSMRAFVEGAESRGLNLSYGAVTNGTVGTAAQAAWLKDKRVSLQRSIDGCPEALAVSRPGILERYRANTEVFGDRRGTRRGTVAPEAAKYLLKSIRFLHEELGFEKGGALMPDVYAAWTDEQIQDLLRSLWDVGREMVRDYRAGHRWRFHWFDKPIAALNGKRCSLHCGAGRGLHAASWDGYLFPCHRFCSEPRDGECCFGSINDILAGTARGYGPSITARLDHARSGWRPAKCDGCPARSSCPGGCAHENFKVGESIDSPPELQCRIRLECVRIVEWMDRQLRPAFGKLWWRDLPGQRAGRPRVASNNGPSARRD